MYVHMNNKKLIRLTEADLHRIVKESVNNVLTELNWKTYANAADKLRDRALKNGEAHVHDKYDGMFPIGTYYDDDDTEDRINALQTAARKSFDKKHGLDDKQHLTFHPFDNKPYLYGDYDTGYNPRPHSSEKKGLAYPKAAKDDLQNYFDGKSKYIKGHGYIEY